MERGLGAIVVEVWYSADQEPAYGGYFLTPSGQGAVHIQDVVGDQVILVSANNTIFDFDLATRLWSWSSPTPTVYASPIPTMTASWQAIETRVEATRVTRATVLALSLALSATIPIPTYPPPTTPTALSTMMPKALP